MMLEVIQTCRFQRKQGGSWETGITLFDGSQNNIADRQGNIVPEVWDIRETTHLRICLTGVFKEMEG